MRIRTETRISEYGDGNEFKQYSVVVRSHASWSDRVEIEHEGHKFTVIIADIIEAVKRCG